VAAVVVVSASLALDQMVLVEMQGTEEGVVVVVPADHLGVVLV
jgi:hypothetical protein